MLRQKQLDREELEKRKQLKQFKGGKEHIMVVCVYVPIMSSKLVHVLT